MTILSKSQSKLSCENEKTEAYKNQYYYSQSLPHLRWVWSVGCRSLPWVAWKVALCYPPGHCPLLCQPQRHSHWWRLRALASDWLVWITLSLLWSVLPHLNSQQNFTWSFLQIPEKWNRRRDGGKSFSN